METSMAEKPANSPRRKWIEPVVAVLIALTTLCTAWCSYDPIFQNPKQTTSHECNLEQHDNRLCVLRVGGERKTIVDAVGAQYQSNIII
jgi:hypothetical protein